MYVGISLLGLCSRFEQNEERQFDESKNFGGEKFFLKILPE